MKRWSMIPLHKGSFCRCCWNRRDVILISVVWKITASRENRGELQVGIFKAKFQKFGFLWSCLVWKNGVWHVRHSLAFFWPFLVVLAWKNIVWHFLKPLAQLLLSAWNYRTFFYDKGPLFSATVPFSKIPFGFCVSVVYCFFFMMCNVRFFSGINVKKKHSRIAGTVQLDQVIAISFAVPLLRKWSFLKCSESFECCFSLAAKLSYSCETIQYNTRKDIILFWARLRKLRQF